MFGIRGGRDIFTGSTVLVGCASGSGTDDCANFTFFDVFVGSGDAEPSSSETGILRLDEDARFRDMEEFLQLGRVGCTVTRKAAMRPCRSVHLGADHVETEHGQNRRAVRVCGHLGPSTSR